MLLKPNPNFMNFASRPKTMFLKKISELSPCKFGRESDLFTKTRENAELFSDF